MLLSLRTIFSKLITREIIAAFLIGVAGAQANAAVAPDWSAIGIKEALNALGDGQKSVGGLVPLKFGGMDRPVYFSVDPEMKTLLVSRAFIAEHNLWEYCFEREIQLPAAGGGVVAGDLVRFYVLMVGDQALRNVQAIVCDDCAEVVGRSVLGELNQN